MSPSFSIGDRVRLTTPPPYFKTAEPMPMLRPPDVVALGAIGDVTEQRAGGYWVVKFERGSFLLDAQYLAPLDGVMPLDGADAVSVPEQHNSPEAGAAEPN
jgi:hypothetical protein